jgi:diguanylate cyclase (GGDEF)-like protein
MAAPSNGLSAPMETVLAAALEMTLKSAAVDHTAQRVITQPIHEEDAIDVAAWEVTCARACNQPFPNQPVDAAQWLLALVQRLCGADEVLLAYYDDDRAGYVLVNDETSSAAALNPRILTTFSDQSLSELLHADAVLQTHLMVGTDLIGMVAIGHSTKASSVTELKLEVLAPYLAGKLLAYRQLQTNTQIGAVQKTVLEVSSHLIKAVDQENVLTITLEAFGHRLGFDVCQYIQRVPGEDTGHVLIETLHGLTTSLMHAGLESKRKVVPQFTSLLGLFKSVARTQPYLLLPGNTLGSQTLKQKFKLSLPKGESIYQTLILPVLDPATGRIRGTINLYRLAPPPVDSATLGMAQELIGLVSLALSRVAVLEMALELASTDELTGLTNRRGFYDRFEAEIERSRRSKAPLSVAMVDVDFFKNINDTYGHLNGDAVLHQLGQTINNSLRKSDMVCRFGGEEFAILLPDTHFEDAKDLLDRIRMRVAEHPMAGLDGKTIPVTVSMGLAGVVITEIPPHTAATEPIHHAIISSSLERADEQLYLAKHHGRNRVCATCAPQSGD